MSFPRKRESIGAPRAARRYAAGLGIALALLPALFFSCKMDTDTEPKEYMLSINVPEPIIAGTDTDNWKDNIVLLEADSSGDWVPSEGQNDWYFTARGGSGNTTFVSTGILAIAAEDSGQRITITAQNKDPSGDEKPDYTGTVTVRVKTLSDVIKAINALYRLTYKGIDSQGGRSDPTPTDAECALFWKQLKDDSTCVSAAYISDAYEAAYIADAKSENGTIGPACLKDGTTQLTDASGIDDVKSVVTALNNAVKEIRVKGPVNALNAAVTVDEAGKLLTESFFYDIDSANAGNDNFNILYVPEKLKTSKAYADYNNLKAQWQNHIAAALYTDGSNDFDFSPATPAMPALTPPPHTDFKENTDIETAVEAAMESILEGEEGSRTLKAKFDTYKDKNGNTVPFKPLYISTTAGFNMDFILKADTYIQALIGAEPDYRNIRLFVNFCGVEFKSTNFSDFIPESASISVSDKNYITGGTYGYSTLIGKIKELKEEGKDLKDLKDDQIDPFTAQEVIRAVISAIYAEIITNSAILPDNWNE